MLGVPGCGKANPRQPIHLEVAVVCRWRGSVFQIKTNTIGCGAADNKLAFALVNTLPMHSYKEYERLL
jgi:hypothetical protein